MRVITIAVTAVILVGATSAGCVQMPAENELAHVHWLAGIKEIIQSNDLSDYRNVGEKFNLTLNAKNPVPVREIDGAIAGEGFNVDTIPIADAYDNNKIRFYYRIYTPADKSYRRAILIVHNVGLSECITVSDIYRAFGYVRGATYAHSSYYSIDYHFKGGNAIDLSLTFDSVDEECVREIAIFQNRWK
jgi:hypothetical protein